MATKTKEQPKTSRSKTVGCSSALKAYKLSCADDDHSQRVVFAKSSKELRGLRADDWCDCEYIDLKVHRAKEFDKYAPGPMTIEKYLAEGWYWTCHGCDHQRYEDDKPLIVGEYVFCDRACLLRSRKVWDDYDPKNCHESVLELVTTLDRWLADNPV